MRIVHLSTSDGCGGAAMATVQLHVALLAQGIESDLVVLNRVTRDVPRVHDFREIDRGLARRVAVNVRAHWWAARHAIRLRGLPPPEEAFSFCETAFDATRHPLVGVADVVHLHWVARFVDYRRFFRDVGRPVVWTLHDRRPFSGGNHCDALFAHDAYETVTARQKHATGEGLAQVPVDALAVVGPSAQYVAASRASPLMERFRHVLIHHGVDASVFRPAGEGQRIALRQKWGVAPHVALALFVTTDAARRLKGLHLVEAAIALAQTPRLVLGVVGRHDARVAEGTLAFGEIRDPRALAELYNVADVLVSASLEESFGLTVAEALCSGLPAVASTVGVAPEVIDDDSGLLFPAGDVGALAECIRAWSVRKDRFSRSAISAHAHHFFDRRKQVAKHLALYEGLQHARHHRRGLADGDRR